jgi:class 3 adenylate cyclase/tetratricopeptide (TPR) repeat protein
MTCASCGRLNRAESRFCVGCGKSLTPRCPACGVESEPEAQFCGACGSALAAPPPTTTDKAIARKVVTVVFADLIGSVSLQERLDAESARRVMDRYHRAMTAVVEVHGGKVVQLLGDGVLAAFGVPRVAEDDALRAVRAGVGMQRAFRELVRELSLPAEGLYPPQGSGGGVRSAGGFGTSAAGLRSAGLQAGVPLEGVGLRVAVNTGEVVVGDDETGLIGDPTNVAARLQHEARNGDVLVGEATQRLVAGLVTLAPAGTFTLRGRSETVTAYRVVSLDRPAGARATAFVGRDGELRRLFAVYGEATAAPGARLAVLLGSPGLGKSRLVEEFTQRASDRATVLRARCDAAGGATFAPIAEALRTFLRLEEGAGGEVLRPAIDAVVSGDEAERARIAAGIGALFSGAPSSPEETFFAVRRMLAGLAAVRPVVLVIDDLHWGGPLLLDLVEHLVQWSTGVPLFLLVTGRPELREARSSLATPGGLVADVITLGGLDAGASMQLAAGVVGAAELPAVLVGRVLATSEGNPLFLGELVRMLVQDGTLVRAGERWVTTVEVAKLDMPPTIQVLLAARIERLRPEERAVLERAAVIGRQFSRAPVAHLLGPVPDLDARLEALRRSELVEPDNGWFLGEPALRFHHVLIRDAAYRRVLKETRAELHERLADWIVARVGDTTEHDETIGFHLEQAHQNRRELGLSAEGVGPQAGPLDARGRALGERAARHLGNAGRRALARDELLPAANLLGRALDRLAADDPGRADLALHWCEALLSAGDVGHAARALDELGRIMGLGVEGEARASPTPNPLTPNPLRLRAWHACFAGHLAVLTDPQALRASEGAVAAAAETLATIGDAAGEAKAHAVHAQVLAQLGRIGASEAALDQALAAARRAGERRLANAVLAVAPVAALWGPSPVTRASGRCLDVVRVLRITQGAPAVEAVALRCQAVLETLRGRGEAARRMIAASRSLVEELGIIQHVLEADLFAGLIELLEGDTAAAEGWLRSAWDGLRAQGLGIDAAQAGALLARALLAQGRIDEAEAVSRESEALAGDSFKAAIAWRGVRAEVLAARGEHSAAIELARAAVDIAAVTDDLLDHADARASLAVALNAAGRFAEAEAEQQHAIELREAKGATLLIERARKEKTAGSPTVPEPVDHRGRDSRARKPPAGFDPEQKGQALAHFEELNGTRGPAPGALPPPPPSPRPRVGGARVEAERPVSWFDNAAIRVVARATEAWERRDLDRIAATLAPDFRHVDRRRMMHLDSGRDAYLESLHRTSKMRSARFVSEVLATRGNRLALRRVLWSGASGSVGPSEVEFLQVDEVDLDDRFLANVTFDLDDLDAAYAELDRRYEAGEGAAYPAHCSVMREFGRAVAGGDWEPVLALCAPAIIEYDHRGLAVLGTTRGAAAWVENFRTLVDLAPDTVYRIDHFRSAARGFLCVGTWHGVQEGGQYEIPLTAVLEMDADDRLARADVYDENQIEPAWERFAELVARSETRESETPGEPWRTNSGSPSHAPAGFANAASRARTQINRCFMARDWDAMRALASEEMVFEDRRRWSMTRGDVEMWIKSAETVQSAADVAFQDEMIVTLGERIELRRRVVTGTDPEGGRFESEFLVLTEVDSEGKIVASINFDPEAGEAASCEAQKRFEAAG